MFPPKQGADVHLQTPVGRTAIIIAAGLIFACFCILSAMNRCLEWNIHETRRQFCKRTLDIRIISTETGNLELVKFLIKNGAAPDQVCVKFRLDPNDLSLVSIRGVLDTFY